MRVEVLSPALECVTVGYWLSPSRFGQLLECRLSVLGEREAEWLLPPLPASIVGSILHHVREQFLLGRWPPGTPPQMALDELLESAIIQAEVGLEAAGGGPGRLVPLRRSLGRRRIDIGRQRLRTWIDADVNPTGEAAHGFEVRLGPSVPSGPSTAMAGPGQEPWLVAPELRLRGRADRIDRIGPEQLLILDYKSGSVVRGEEDEVDPSASLQLRLYGLIVEHVLEVGVRLRLVADRAHPVEWNHEESEGTKALLNTVLAELPMGAELDARSLASPGPACARCRLRPACAQYLEDAPALWDSDTLRGQLPLDVWGFIETVETTVTGRLFRLRTPAGRLATVAIPEEGRALSPGTELFVFDGRSAERRRPHGRIVHPRNFDVSLRSPGRPPTLFVRG